MPHPFDPGSGRELIAALCGEYPGPEVYPPSCAVLSVSPNFLLDTEGARKPYTEPVFSPERARECSPAQAPQRAALGRSPIGVCPSPPHRSPRIRQNGLPERGRGEGEWGTLEVARGTGTSIPRVQRPTYWTRSAILGRVCG